MSFSTAPLLVAGLLSFVLPISVFAQVEVDEPFEQNYGWTYSILTGMENEPAYTGSDEIVTEVDFNIEAVYRSRSGHEYSFSPAEIGVLWKLSENSALSTVLEYEFGRDNADDAILTGFPVIEDTVEAQIIYRHGLGPIILGGGLQIDILDRGKGLVGFIGGAYHHEFSNRFSVLTQVDLSFADAEHMNTEVGVLPQVAATTGLRTYTAGSGYKGISAQVSLATRLSQSWTIQTALGLETYSSIMADSPLIKDEGNRTTYEASIGIQYSF